MAEPAQRNAAIGCLVTGKLAHHTAFRAGMGKHVNKVEHHHVQVVFPQIRQLLYQFFCRRRIIDLVVSESVVSAVTVKLRLYQWGFVQVLSLFRILIHPQFGEHTGYDVGHQSAEDGISRILCGRGKNAAIQAFFNGKEIGNLIVQHTPLVITEIVYYKQEHLFALVQIREHLFLENVRTHDRAVVRIFHPPHVVLTDKLGKLRLCLLALHTKHLHHSAVCLRKLQFPVSQLLVRLYPFVQSQRIVYLQTYLAKILLIGRLRHLGYNLLVMYVLLQRKQNLRGIDWLYQIVGYLRTDGLIHDVLFLALGHHHNWHAGMNGLYAVQGFQPAYARHVLIEQNQVKIHLRTFVQCVKAIGHRGYVISFFLKKQDMRLEQINLIVYP